MSNWDVYSSSGTKAIQQRDLELAENMWLAALEEATDFDDNDSRLAYTIESLAEVYYRQGDFDQAGKYCRRVLELYEKTLSPDHPDVGVLAHNLAMLYHMQCKYMEAEPLYKKAMTIRTKALGSKHPEVIRLLQSYADLLEKTHREAEAQHLKQCIEGVSTGRWTRSGRWTVFSSGARGSDHLVRGGAASMPAEPEQPQDVTAHDLSGAAQGLSALQSEEPQPVPAFEKSADADFQPQLRPTGRLVEGGPPAAPPPPSSGKKESSKGDGGKPSKSAGKSADKQPPAQPSRSPQGAAPNHSQLQAGQAQQINQQSPPSDVQKTIENWQTYRSFASDALSKGNLGVAENLWRSAMLEAEKLGPLDPRLAASLEALADVLAMQSKFEEAEVLLRRSMAIKTACLGSTHVAVALCHSSLAKLFYSKTEYESAVAHAKECVRIYSTASGAEHPDTACALYNLALIYHFQKDFEEAEKTYAQALTIRRKTLGETHVETLKVKSNYEKLLASKAESGLGAPRQKMKQQENVLISGTWKVLELDPDIQLGRDDKEET